MSSITKKGILSNKNYHKEENDDVNNNEDENGNEENDNIPDQDKIGQQNKINHEDQNANNNDANNNFNNTYQNPKQNFDNIGPKSRGYLSSSSPIIDDRNPKYDNNNYNTNPEIHRPNIDPFSSTTQTVYINNNRMNGQKPNINNNKKFVSGIAEEESEEDISNNNIYKSQEEIIDENEKIFIEYLKALIKSELEIEYAKRDLMRQEDFNAEDAFRLFEKEGTNVVTKNDLIYGLKLLGIKPTNNQIKIIFNKYDLDGNDFIDYDDFFDMVISFKDSDRKKEEKRKPNRNVPNRNINLFSQRTRELYKKLFLVIIEEEERLEELRQRLNIDDNMMNEIFYKINVDRDGLCNKNEFANYCMRKKICSEKKDAYLAFIRLNRSRDGGLQSEEFSIELKSSVLWH
jgi:Ca2+-binding EF-hand superfamily protein